MSYFQTLSGFMDNAQASREHAEEFTKELRDQRANTLLEKIEAKQNDVNEYAQQITGASEAFHMGRKILQHIKDSKKAVRGKTTAQKQEEEETTKEPPSDLDLLTNEEAESLFKEDEEQPIHQTTKIENQDEALNPFSNEAIQAPSKPELIPDEGEEVTNLSKQPQLSYAEEASDRIMGTTTRPRPVEPEPEPETTSLDEGLQAFKGKAGQLGAKAEEGGGISELMDGSNSIAQGAKEIGKKVVSNISKSVGTSVGEDVGEGILNTALDGIPIVGEIVGLSTLFGNLYHSIHAKKKEEEETKAEASKITAPSPVVGGIDVGSVLQEGKQSLVSGLV